VSKYVYIFHLKNPLAFNYEYWTFFIQKWICIYAILTEFVSDSMPGKKTVNYYFCTGMLPPETPVNFLRFSHRYLVNFLIFFTNFVTVVRIQFFKLKTHSSHTSTSSNNISNNFNYLKVVLSDLKNNLFLGFMFLLQMFLVGRINKIEPIMYNKYPNYLYFHSFNFLWVNTVGMLIALKFYINDAALRKYFKEEFCYAITKLFY